MYGLSGFFIGEQRVTDELGPIMRACPKEEQRIFLSTQIADEARHVRFFDRFYSEVGVYEGTNSLADRLRATEENLNESFGQLFDDLLHTRVDRLAAEPEDTVALVEAVTLYHMVIEGALALTGQHFIIEYNTEQNTLPAFVEGFNKVARDEHRHIAFGVRFLTDMAQEDPKYRDAMQRMMGEALPIADGVLDPPWAEDEDLEMFGVSRDETHAFAAQCLTRRLKVIGLA
jgi:ribonucleoside-diphosphate reductase beta chain